MRARKDSSRNSYCFKGASFSLRVRLDPLPALAAIGFALLMIVEDTLTSVDIASAGAAL